MLVCSFFVVRTLEASTMVATLAMRFYSICGELASACAPHVWGAKEREAEEVTGRGGGAAVSLLRRGREGAASHMMSPGAGGWEKRKQRQLAEVSFRP